jgi:hypothetical protein
MKKLFFTTLLVMFIGIVSIKAQDCTYYFPVKVGSSMETKSYNDKDKLTGSAKSKVISHTGNTVKYTSEAFDSKDKSISKGDFEVRCENNEAIVDMSSYLKGFNKDAFKGMDVKVDSKAMSIPANLKVGQKLNDGEVTMKISNQGVDVMTISTKIYNRKVEALEDITAPAGKFKCAKITYDIESKSMMLIKTKGIEWISAKVGVVRNESYDQNGKLTGYSVLSSFSE